MLIDRSKTPVASVVIPAYNSKGTISRCLDALVDQDTDLDYEIIVVESSGDGTSDVVRQRYPLVQLIEPGKRAFPGAARNIGAEQARGELLLFVDSDCIAEPQWLQKMWRTHHDWDCSAVAGSILNGNPETPVSISSYMNEFSHFFAYGKPRYMDYLPSGNLSYKMSIFRKYGGFASDEPVYEDLIFNKLLSRAGEKLLFNPDIKAAHLHRVSLREYLGHEYRRGKGGAVARRMGLLIGSSWTRYPALAFISVPGLFLRKATVFPFRMFRAYPAMLPRLIVALPCFYLALVVWHYGFLTEVVRGQSGGDSDG